MSEVIRLTAKDDIRILRAQLEAITEEAVIVYVPKGVRSLRRRLSLRLLARQAERLGKELVIIAEDIPTREEADREGLLVFPNSKALNKAAGRPIVDSNGQTDPLATVQSGRRKGNRRPFVILVNVAILAWIGSFLLLPTVTVTMVLAAQTMQETIEATVSRRATSIDFENRRIPAQTRQIELTISSGTNASGMKNAPEATAEGELTIVNKTGDSLNIPTGTRFATTNGVQFALREDTTVPAGNGNSARVAIISVEGGGAGNVEIMAINQPVDSQLTYRIACFNESPTAGGKDKEVKWVRQEDREALRNQLLENAKTQGLLQLANARKPSDVQFTDTATVEVIDEVFDKQVNDEADTVEFRMRARISMLSTDSYSLEDLAEGLFGPRVSPGYQIMPDTIEAVNLQVVKQDADSVSVRYLARGKAAQAIDKDRVRSDISGKLKGDVSSFLSSTYPLARKPEIEVKPDWLPILPYFGFRTDVKIEVEK